MSSQRSATGEVSLGTMNAADRRAAILRDEQERAAARQERLAAQCSPLNSPEDRIRIWERLHSLRLPQSPTHTLIRVIAVQTGLSVPEVREEQRRRAGGADATPIEMTP